MLGFVNVGNHIFWLASRASGTIGLLLLTFSVALGLVASGKLSTNAKRIKITFAHEISSLVAMFAVLAHGLFLLGDTFINPGLSGVFLPFAMTYKTLWTGLGIIAAYLMALLGLSFYLRQKIGTKLWRSMHRFIIIAWLFSMLHTLGSGSDANSIWMEALLLAQTAVVVILFIARILPARRQVAVQQRAAQ